MKIDDCDSLKKWLVQVLTPIFDGDPEKLALYIVALAKKVENDLSSRERCVEDLEVFLEAQTNTFVSQLFDALVNKTYVSTSSGNGSGCVPQKEEPVVQLASAVQQQQKQQPASTAVPVLQSQRSRDRESSNRRSGGGGGSDYHRSSAGAYYSSSSSSHHTRRRSRSPGRRRPGGGGGYRNRSRGSRSRLNRGSSPSSSSSSSPSPVKRRSRSRSPYNSRSRSRSRSPAYKSGSSRNHNIVLSSDKDSIGNGLGTKKQRCKDYDEKGFCTAGELCPYEHTNAVIAPNPLASTVSPGVTATTGGALQITQPPQVSDNSGNFQSRQPYNNGNKRMKPMNRFRGSANVGGANGAGGNMPPQSSQPPIGLMPQRQIIGVNTANQMTSRPRNLVNVISSDDRSAPIKRSYDYSGPYMPSSLPPPMIPVPQLTPLPPQQTALLPTPPTTALLPTPPQLQLHQSHLQPQFIPTSVPPSHGVSHEYASSSLVLRRIPVELNRVDKMSQHFSQFGPILDIQCKFEHNTDAALVVFANQQSAQAAYKNPQPVFNNRFIRLYWLTHHLKMRPQQQHHQQRLQHQQFPNNQMQVDHIPQQSSTIASQDQLQDQQHQQQDDDLAMKRVPAKERLSWGNNTRQPFQTSTAAETQSVPNNKENAAASEVITKTIYNSDITASPKLSLAQLSLKTSAAADDSKKDPNLVAMTRQIQTENQRKAMLLKAEVQRKARELIEKQIKDQKVLLDKFEKAKTSEEKSQISELIKKIQEAIEKEREILNDSTTTTLSTPPAPTRTRVTPAPHHLLKLNNKRLTTTSFLKATPTATPTSSPKSPLVATPIGTQPPPSLFNYSKVSVDNRPRKLLFTGLNTQNEKTNIVQFISSLGVKIESAEQSNETNADDSTSFSLIILFSTRKDAEYALAKCSASLTSKKIKIAWYKESQSVQPKPQESSTTGGGSGGGGGDAVVADLKPQSEQTKDDEKPEANKMETSLPVNDENNDVFDEIFSN